MCAYCSVKSSTCAAGLLQLRLQGGGVLLVLPREVGHQLREIGDPRAQHVQFLGVLLLDQYVS